MSGSGSVGVPAALAAVGYLIAGLHDLAGWLDPLRYVSAFWWVGRAPLREGASVSGMLVVAAAAAGALVAAAYLIERRDQDAVARPRSSPPTTRRW